VSEAVDALVFQAKAVGLPAPELELRFHPTRRWKFDLAWPEQRVAVEVDGGVWTGGRHVTGTGATKDAEKYSEAAAMGWRIVRVTTAHVDDGRAIAWIERALGMQP